MNLYPQVRYQTFLGFGGAITEAVGLVLQALPPETARQVLNSYYGPSGIGYSLVRTHLDSCDFSRENYCAIEDEDTDFFHLLIAPRRKGTLFPTSSWLRN